MWSEDSDEESAVVKVTKRSRKGGLVEKVSRVVQLHNVIMATAVCEKFLYL